MVLDHIVVSESKEALKEQWGHVKEDICYLERTSTDQQSIF